MAVVGSSKNDIRAFIIEVDSHIITSFIIALLFYLMIRKYDFFKKIEDKSKLAALFNNVMDKINVLRIVTAPRFFGDKNEMFAEEYYDTCLWEIWLHEAIATLRIWEKELGEYIEEFNGSWKYYASCKRIESIKEFGGEDGDYNEDGSIRTENITDEELKPYTITDSLFNKGMRDIVLDADMNDLYPMCLAVSTSTKIHAEDFFSTIGKPIPVYKKNEDGTFTEMSFSEKVTSRAVSELEGEDLCSLMLDITRLICSLSLLGKTYEPTLDNSSELSAFKSVVSKLLNLDFELMETVRNDSSKPTE